MTQSASHVNFAGGLVRIVRLQCVGIVCGVTASSVCIIVAKFEEINFKSSKKFEIHVQSQLLSEDTQYSQYCNNVKLHAIQCTSSRFLTTAVTAQFNKVSP